MRVCIVLTVSRSEHLPAIFAALEVMQCNAEQTGLLVITDGDAGLHVLTRNFCEQSKFASRLCVQYPSGRKLSEYAIQQRRMRISAIKNFSKQHIPDCQYVLGIEDDGAVSPNALEQLLRAYGEHPFAGFISGVQLGRHGLPHVGAWKADDVYDPTMISSLMPAEGLEEVDAAGWFLYLTKREHYIGYEYRPFDNNQLGPDVQWGIELRRQGLRNFLDWALKIEHRTTNGNIMFANTTPVEVRLTNEQGAWKLGVMS